MSESPGYARSLPLVLLLAIIAACSSGDSSPTPHPGLGVYIPSIWTQVREVRGHRVHVVDRAVPCRSCHTLGDTEIGPVAFDRCGSCHAEEATIRHAPSQALAVLGKESPSDCTLCHRFTEGPSRGATETTPAGALLDAHAHEPQDCAHCHLVPQGKIPAVRVHETEACVDCHRPHQDAKPQAAPCAGCHTQISTSHALAGKAPNEVCTTCHQKQHARASEALGACLDCHREHEPKVPETALFAGGHLECVGCHRPHDFARAAATSCRGCHEGLLVLGGARVTAHGACTNCHAPHDVKGSPELACKNCHGKLDSDHPAHGKSTGCVGCHDPHPSFQHRTAVASDCSFCHQAATSDTSFHEGVKCKSCHVPHDFVRDLGDHRACAACHEKELALVSHRSGHQACQGCHRGLPHQPKLLQAGCETCHQKERAQTNAGHARCAGCHEPHAGAVSTTCGSCHRAEQASAPAGHQACRNCHEAHTGSPAAAPCAKCHEPEARTAHGAISATCESCHRPHGPRGVAKAPACTTCHERATLGGLHQVSRHSTCTNCHGGHGDKPGARREGCLSCHTDRKQHFPDAPSCSSCHLFGKP
jgi:hypothetical protein